MPPTSPSFALATVLAAFFLVVEIVLVILLKQVDPRDPVGLLIAILLGVALVANFVVGVAAARAAGADRRRELQTSRDQIQDLAEQQAALRRVATLVARGARPSEVFSAVAEEMGRCLNVEGAAVSRYDGDGVVMVAIAPIPTEFKDMVPLGERGVLDGDNVFTRVLRTGLPARMDTLASATGAIAEHLRALGVKSIVAVPIIVGSQVWGTATAGSTGPEPPPPDTEARMGDFTDLVATAIASAAAHADLQASRDRSRALAEHQAALRRVATLVARGGSPAEVFETVTDELVRSLHAQNVGLLRSEGDGTATLMAARNEPGRESLPGGARVTLEGDNIPAMVLKTGLPARQDSLKDTASSFNERIHALGMQSGIGVPVIVDGRVWGVLGAASSGPNPLPPDTETLIGDFTDLVATAIANAATRDDLQASRDDLGELADRQAALRRVATLVAGGVGPAELFNAVAEEIVRCLNTDTSGVWRFEPGDAITLVAAHSKPGSQYLPVGERLPVAGDNLGAMVLRTGRAVRQDTVENCAGPAIARVREMGIRQGVGAPITVDGRVWGFVAAGSMRSEPMPADWEQRIGDFADLVATALANAATRDDLQASRDQLQDLAEQQAALRRVATLIARGASPSDVFSAVADEMGRCLNVEGAAVSRYDGEGIVLVGIAPLPAEFMDMARFGELFPLDGDNVYTRMLRSGVPARMDTLENDTGAIAEHLRALGIQSMVGVPIIVGGQVWGTATAGSTGPEPVPPDTEARISDFADLVATAIANAATRDALQGSRDQFGELADRQAALRRVATLVARGVDPAELFTAVAEEMTHCLGAELAAVWRYEADSCATLLATNPDPDPRAPIGVRVPLEGENLLAMVLDSGRAARQETFEIDNATGLAVARVREIGIRNAVGAPIVLDGRVWGMAGIGSSLLEPPPPDTEHRLGDFADLVATALANAATRDELIASRARIVAAADEARRRIERDLHDGAQQQLVSLGLQLRLAEESAPPGQHDLRERLSDVVSGLTAVSSELQQISRGIHPAILSEGGLGPALKALARRCPVLVTLDVAVDRRLPEPVEVAAYYVVAEALTNVAKYAHASEVNVCAETKGANLDISIRDDGIGGADTRNGSGLIGLQDRVEVLGGRMQIASHPGRGTTLYVTIPVKRHDSLQIL